MTDKLCPRCKTIKPADDFYKSAKRPDGLSSYCKPCQLANAQENYTPHPRWKAPEGMKRCPKCDSIKPLDQFGSNRTAFDGKATYCKPCAVAAVTSSRHKDPTSHRESSKRWKDQNPERHKDNNAKRNYGVAHGTYARMFSDQGGYCAICGRPPKDRKRLHIDHCHDTGKVRGLLCSPCNTGIGQLQHDTDLLAKAISYLRLHSPEGAGKG